MHRSFALRLHPVVRALLGCHGARGVSTHATVVAGGMHVTTPNQMFINGKFVESSSKARYETYNPATEKVLLTINHIVLS
jgi:hypothetical protein